MLYAHVLDRLSLKLTNYSRLILCQGFTAPPTSCVQPIPVDFITSPCQSYQSCVCNISSTPSSLVTRAYNNIPSIPLPSYSCLSRPEHWLIQYRTKTEIAPFDMKEVRRLKLYINNFCINFHQDCHCVSRSIRSRVFCIYILR